MADVSNPRPRYPLAENIHGINSAMPSHQQPYAKAQSDNGAYDRENTPYQRPQTAQGYYVPSEMHGSTGAPDQDELEANKRFSQASYESNSSGKSRRSYKTRIGPWQLGRTLGKGSSARVRLCRHNMTKQLAAVKIVNRRMAYLVQDSSLAALSKHDRRVPDQSNGEKRVPMAIEREVAILKLIEHPNIMKLYDIWENQSEIYLVLEYIDQGDLFTFINAHGRLNEEMGIYFFRQIISAISYCHSFNICHRDLKPENILITADHQIKIADFGMAALHQTATHRLDTACGSPHYAAPELLKNRQYRGDRADIWSLGVILHAMLSASLPFDDPSMRVLMSKTKRGVFSMPPFLSPEAQDLIRRMLQLNPDYRITLKEIWQHPLVRKYAHLDDYTDDNGQLPDTRKGFQFTPVSRQDIDPQLLRQLRSMWHMFSEQELAWKLSCEERNDQKAFYWLLHNYRDKQLEDFKPELVHSTSDYHHLQPGSWKKRISTCQFTQPGINGHGRSVSRFTVISNAAETEVGTIQSYDPYRGSRMLQRCGSQVSQARIIVHRDSVRSASSQAARARSGSQVCRPRAASSVRGRPQSSRGSVNSLRSTRQATPHAVGPGLRHKRGVDFSHIRNRSSSAARNQRSSSRAGSAKFPNPASITQTQKFRQGTPELDGPIPQAKGAPIKADPYAEFSEEIRHFSNNIAKDCDKAFRSSLIRDASIAGSATDTERAHRDMSSLTLYQGHEEPVTAQHVATSYYESRPLPPLPPDSPLSPQTTMSGVSGPASIYSRDDDIESVGQSFHRAQKVALPALVIKPSDRRVVSAPATGQGPRHITALPSIIENGGFNNAGNEKARIVSAPPHTPPKKFCEFPNVAGTSIRVVYSPPAPGQVKVPEPLNVRKVSSASETTQDGGPERTSRTVSGRSTNVADQDATHQENAKKKKSSWFKRVSRAESDLESSLANSVESTPTIASQVVSRHEWPTRDGGGRKKSFVFPFWKGNKTRDSKMSIPEEPEDEQDQKRVTKSNMVRKGPGSQWHESNSGSVRNIEVKQNWLARLFRVKPATRYICMTLSRKRARQETALLLREWRKRKYGIKGIQVDKKRNIIFGRVAAENYLNMKEVAFAAEVMTVIEHGKRQPLSIVRFTQERGAASSFHRVVDTMKLVFENYDLLVTDKSKRKMMIKTLNS